MVKTKSINILNLNVYCNNNCRYCLLNWDGKLLGIDYERSIRYSKRFYEWLKENHPTIDFIYYFGYSMEHPKLFDAIKFMQETNSPGGSFLQFDGMNMRTKEELYSFIKKLKESGIKLLDFTFYGTKEYHDKFAARIGDYDLMMNSIFVAEELGVKVEVGIPVTKENLCQLDELVNIFSKMDVDLFLFTPHSMGRGMSLITQKITLSDYENMSEKVKKYFNRNSNKTQNEWLLNPPMEVQNRTLTLALELNNIEKLENEDFKQTLDDLEQMDEAYYNVIPSFCELLKIYASKTDDHLYTKKDLYYLYRKRYILENKLTIKDITDERYSNSIRY